MKKWMKILLVLFTFITISIVLYFILKSFGITNIKTIKNLVTKSGKYGYIVYTTILTILLIALCFVPLLNTTMAILGTALFGARIAFITNVIAVFISSSVLFFIGDKLGEGFAKKLIGEKSLNEVQNKIDHKSKFWLPILFITPGIPDEGICLVAGMTKIKYWYLVLVSVIYHAAEIGLFCFLGGGRISWSSLTILDWIILSNVILVDIYLLFKLEKFLYNKK